MSILCIEIAEDRFDVIIPNNEYSLSDQISRENGIEISRLFQNNKYILLIKPCMDGVGQIISTCHTLESVKQTCFTYLRDELKGEENKFDLVAVNLRYGSTAMTVSIGSKEYYLFHIERLCDLNTTIYECNDEITCCRLSDPGTYVNIHAKVYLKLADNRIVPYIENIEHIVH